MGNQLFFDISKSKGRRLGILGYEYLSLNGIAHVGSTYGTTSFPVDAACRTIFPTQCTALRIAINGIISESLHVNVQVKNVKEANVDSVETIVVL